MPSDLNAGSKKSRQPGKTIAPYVDLGLRFAISILIGAGGGYWLDSKLHTLPLFLIVGLLLGATSGFMAIYKTVYPDDSETKTKE